MTSFVVIVALPSSVLNGSSGVVSESAVPIGAAGGGSTVLL
jgi:hypothetical protein